ncbi:MAG: septum formation initiator family protein [Pseudomonadota bacterium]|nr:septum formation initiator family protein [Pseudomonadota bacterium]
MRLRKLIFPVICIALMGYFGYHMFVGNHGLGARDRISKQITMLDGELKGLKAVRSQLERDVALLRAERLDPDMLDERARAILNFAHPNDLVIIDKRAAEALPR